MSYLYSVSGSDNRIFSPIAFSFGFLSTRHQQTGLDQLLDNTIGLFSEFVQVGPLPCIFITFLRPGHPHQACEHAPGRYLLRGIEFGKFSLSPFGQRPRNPSDGLIRIMGKSVALTLCSQFCQRKFKQG